MNEINQRLDIVLTKGDGTLNNLLLDLKEDLLKFVNKSIEIIEGRLLDKEKGCDNLKNHSKGCKKSSGQKRTALKPLKEIDQKRRK